MIQNVALINFNIKASFTIPISAVVGYLFEGGLAVVVAFNQKMIFSLNDDFVQAVSLVPIPTQARKRAPKKKTMEPDNFIQDSAHLVPAFVLIFVVD